MSEAGSRLLKFTTHAHLRQRLVLSLLSRRPIRIDEIRSTAEQPGLNESEVSFLRLIERITEGTRIEISYSGTSVLFHPGTLSGGTHVHTCPLDRAVGWYLEPLLAIAPFGKKDLNLTLNGVTTNAVDLSVDALRTAGLPHLAMFLESEGVELRITRRGHPPLGGGQVNFTCPSVKAVKAGFDFTNTGRIAKIRGIAHSVRVSPQLANRLVSSARSVLNQYIPDVYIYTDVYKGEESGKSPGYAITLVASSTSHALHSSEASSCPPRQLPAASTTRWVPPSPEDVGLQAAKQLLAEIARGGCIDRGFEWLCATMLVLGAEDVGKVTVGGPFEPALVQHLRDLKRFFGTTFKIKPVVGAGAGAGAGQEEAQQQELYTLSCVGTGYTNTARRAG